MILDRRSALALLGAGALAFAAPALAQRGGRGLAAPDPLTSGGVPITVERFDPPGGSGRRPAVLLLHGADGPGERYRAAARQVAAVGYPVFFVHYLDRTGDRRAGFGSIGRNLPVWAETARDAVDWIARQPGVDGTRIAIFGVSLGGGLALLAAAGEPRVRAIVDYFGFVPSTVTAGVRLPPTLILHGEADRVVPVSNALTLQRILEAQGTAYDIQIYPGEGHGFSSAAQADAAARIAAFLNRTIGAAGARSVRR